MYFIVILQLCNHTFKNCYRRKKTHSFDFINYILIIN